MQRRADALGLLQADSDGGLDIGSSQAAEHFKPSRLRLVESVPARASAAPQACVGKKDGACRWLGAVLHLTSRAGSRARSSITAMVNFGRSRVFRSMVICLLAVRWMRGSRRPVPEPHHRKRCGYVHARTTRLLARAPHDVHAAKREER